MAAAGSSLGRGSRARKRGADQIAQEDLIAQETSILQIGANDPRLRKIKYQRAHEWILTSKVNRLDHPILQFESSTPEWDKYDKLTDTDLLQHRGLDWTWLDAIGSRQVVLDLLGPKLTEALDCGHEQYEELVLEFHSTWKHKEGKFDDDKAVSFSLGRQVFEMNMARFAIVSGFYTEEEVKQPGFVTSLRGAYTTVRKNSVGGAELRNFWKTISDHPFIVTNLITSVRNPVYRYVLKILSTTLVGRKSGEN
ncbi:hypothetical protein HanOQP8_Chr01g0011221 [Helianthus annuus]|nr:hypothetical protein HanOQP8_Chr01g0011221 [Helianthus annuus]